MPFFPDPSYPAPTPQQTCAAARAVTQSDFEQVVSYLPVVAFEYVLLWPLLLVIVAGFFGSIRDGTGYLVGEYSRWLRTGDGKMPPSDDA